MITPRQQFSLLYQTAPTFHWKPKITALISHCTTNLCSIPIKRLSKEIKLIRESLQLFHNKVKLYFNNNIRERKSLPQDIQFDDTIKKTTRAIRKYGTTHKFISNTLRDASYPIYGKIQSQKYFTANSIYGITFQKSYYKTLVQHFLPFVNKQWMKMQQIHYWLN